MSDLAKFTITPDPDSDQVTITTTQVGLQLLGLSASLAFALTNPMNHPFHGIARRLLQEGEGCSAEHAEMLMAALYVFTDKFVDEAVDGETIMAIATPSAFGMTVAKGDGDV